MNIFKKSQAKVWFFLLTGFIFVGIALFRHPSTRPMFSYTSQQTWQDLIKTLESASETEAQDLWKFREFYSRGTVYLSKYQPIQVPSEIQELYSLPSSFTQQMVFNSSKVQSAEGSIDLAEQGFLSENQIKEKGWETHIRTESVQIIENKEKTKALIIGVFDIETASQANGYLYFDLRDKVFETEQANKKWLVIDLVSI